MNNRILAIAIAAVASMGASALAGKPPKQGDSPQISISQVASDRFELVYSGRRFESRDGPEERLLLSGARLALAHGQEKFVLLALPGELQDVHPRRPSPSFGAKYGHWQPHWNYYIPEHGWQLWKPEWGAEFWTKDVDPRTVERFDVHAMIELGSSANAAAQGLEFRAPDILRDLSRPPSVRARVSPHRR